jgi:hypothetical protein
LTTVRFPWKADLAPANLHQPARATQCQPRVIIRTAVRRARPLGIPPPAHGPAQRLETCSAPTPGSPGRGARTPGGGEALFGELLGSARSRLRGDGTVGFGRSNQARGRKDPLSGAVAQGGYPWRGLKPKGGTSRLAFGRNGHGLPRRRKPGRRARTPHGSGQRVRSSQRQAGKAGRETCSMPWKGNPSKGRIPRALPSETWR